MQAPRPGTVRSSYDSSGPKTVLIVDDHEGIREALHELISAQPDLVVVGLAGTVRQAVVAAEGTHCDIAIIDVSMPDGGGWAVATDLRIVTPEIRLIAYSAFDRGLVMKTMRALGIAAFVSKGSSPDVLLGAVYGRDMEVQDAPVTHPLMDRLAREVTAPCR